LIVATAKGIELSDELESFVATEEYAPSRTTLPSTTGEIVSVCSLTNSAIYQFI